MTSEEVYQISLPYATFGIIVRENYVSNAAPIGRWMIGKTLGEVLQWVRKKNGSCIRCPTSLTAS
jgi:transcription elongation GreA/GreB family factor